MNADGFPDYNINGLIPFDSYIPDVLGCMWFSEGEIVGWDSPDVRVTLLTRIGSDASADGEIPADLHYRGRELVFTIWGVCPDEETQERAIYQLTGATDLVDSTGLFYANEQIPKQVVITRGNNMGRGNIAITRNAPSAMSSNPAIGAAAATLTDLQASKVYIFKADMQLYCPDPRKYAQVPTVTAFAADGTLDMTNQGNTTTQNVLITLTTIGGGAGPINIEVGSQVMTLLVPVVGSGAPALNPIPTELIIDVYNKTITDGSGINYFYLRDLTTPWPTLKPGMSSVSTSPIQAGSFAMRSAWI